MLELTYLIYIAMSLGITIWVGRTLNKNGRVFLLANFKNNEAVADSINHLLLVGFYLINIGFICYTLEKNGAAPMNYAEGIEFLSKKIGFIVIVLGIMHFALMFVLAKFQLNTADEFVEKVLGKRETV